MHTTESSTNNKIPCTDERLNESYNDDPLYLQGLVLLGLQRVNVKLNGSNFERWTKSMRFALKAKAKICFIDGFCSKPSIYPSTNNQWIRCDSIVVSYVLNSMVPDLSESFLYVDSTQQLRNELTKRFVESNVDLRYVNYGKKYPSFIKGLIVWLSITPN